LISLKEVRKQYGRGTVALKELSFTVNGESLAILGDKGAGKTSLSRILCGITAPSAGSATVDGVPLSSREAASKIGYTPFSCALNPSLTLNESLEALAKIRGLNAESVETALEEVGIKTDIANIPVGMLGNGAKKRASLAMAILGRPTYLVLDQPLSGLDDEEESEITELLQSISERYVLIYFSDTVDDAKLLCNQVLLLSNGKSVAYDSFDAVISPNSQIVEYKIRSRGDVDTLRSALTESKEITKFRISVTASGTSIIELTVSESENAEALIRGIFDAAEQKILDIKKADSPVEKVLSRLYDIQDARDEEKRLRREEKAPPVKLTEAFLEQAILASDDDSDVKSESADTEKSSDENRNNTVNRRKDDLNISITIANLSENDDSADADSDDGESTLF